MTNLEVGLKVVSILIFLTSVWIGLKKIRTSSFVRTAIFLIDTGLSIAAVVQLGWIGIGLALMANILAAVIWSVRLAMQKENLLTKASTQGRNSVDEVELLYDRLADEHKVFEYIGPIERARLILLLSQRGRTASEILHMAPPIAMLQQVINVNYFSRAHCLINYLTVAGVLPHHRSYRPFSLEDTRLEDLNEASYEPTCTERTDSKRRPAIPAGHSKRKTDDPGRGDEGDRLSPQIRNRAFERRPSSRA